MMASYRFPLRISRSTNLTQSSTIHRMGALPRPEGLGVLLCPSYHAFGGVHMRDGGSGLSGSQGSAACVCKKVKNLYRPSGCSDFRAEPVPVGGLLGEKPGMLKAEGLQMKCKAIVANGPLIRKIKKFPLSASFTAAVIMTILFFPGGIRVGSVPYNLGIWPYQQVFSPSLQLLASGAVDDFIIVPFICKPHRLTSFPAPPGANFINLKYSPIPFGLSIGQRILRAADPGASDFVIELKDKIG